MMTKMFAFAQMNEIIFQGFIVFKCNHIYVRMEEKANLSDLLIKCNYEDMRSYIIFQ